jgi:hypothetical protein
MEGKKIDFSRYRRSAENDEFERQLNPERHIRLQDEVERHPTFFRRRQQLDEGRSNWSGVGRSR